MTKGPNQGCPSPEDEPGPSAENGDDPDSLARNLGEIAARCAALPTLDDQPDEETLGTGVLGLSGRFVYSRPGELRLISGGDPEAEPIEFSPFPRVSVRRQMGED